MKKHAYKQLLLGMIAMLIVMSISRFAYTPILPFMQQDTSMDNQEAGFLATWNYLGYLVGAVIPIFYIYKTKVIDLKIYLALNIISTILMGFTEQYLIWSIFRLISGITSGTVFVLTSNIVLDSLKKIQREGISGVLYSAVGLGIFLSSIYLYFFASLDSWKMVWFVLGIVSLVLGLIVLVFMKENTNTIINFKEEKMKINNRLNKKFVIFFSIAYFFEGAGYIITGTFLVAIVKSIPSVAEYATLSWMFVGLGAIPSTLIWSLIAEKISYKKAIYGAFILQIISVCLPVFTHEIFSLVISSVLFGGTFLGLTTLFISKGQSLMYKTDDPLNLVSLLTVIYSLGQMLAPMFAGILIGKSNNYNIALIFATVLLILGLISTIFSYKQNESIGEKYELK